MTTLAGRYEVTTRLGGGGFAITFLARDIMQPSKPVCVVKQLRPDQTQPQVIECFHKEAAILEKLGEHPQIPRLLAHFQEGDNLYIVQEFIEGHDLSREISPGKQLNEDFVSNLLQEVLEVLSFVHKYGVIHRDIKPQNLMRREEDGRIFLIDFGGVKELGSLMVNSHGEVASSVIIGTPGYMPNEQGLGKPCLASDVYALGMTAIAALSGIQPFELEENPHTGEVIWLEKTQVSQDFAEIISKMVRRHFSLRYLCADDALQALDPLTRTVPSIPFTSSTTLKVPDPQTSQQTASTQTTPTQTKSQFQSQQSPKSKQSSGPISVSSATNSSAANAWKRRKIIQQDGDFTASILEQAALQNFSSKSNISGGSDPGVSDPGVSDIENSDIESSKKADSRNILKSSLLNDATTARRLGQAISSPSMDGAIALKSFNFEVVTVNAKGDITNRQPSDAKYFTEYLGNGVNLEMVEIPGGEFFMGSPVVEEGRDDDESPQHKVDVKSFFMGKFAVTQAQYQEIMGKNPSRFPGKKRPVEQVTWDDANEFCCILTQKTGRTYRLPSEAEWEYACRALTTTVFHFGETITTDLANYDGRYTYANSPKGEYRQQTTEVGSFPPNAFGLYDMHGNVWEWCQDIWHKSYDGAPDDGSAWNSNDTYILSRVMRGGSGRINPQSCRCAVRRIDFPLVDYSYAGFRVVCVVVP